MNRKIVFLIAPVLMALSVLLWGGYTRVRSTSEAFPTGPTPGQSLAQPTPEQIASPSASWDLSPQRSDEGGVAVEVRPTGLGADHEVWEFIVTLNTHSVDLDNDLSQVSVLRNDQGIEYPAQGWEGSPPGGHHRQGVLRFAALNEPTSFLEVAVRGVADVPERVFRWEAKSGNPSP